MRGEDGVEDEMTGIQGQMDSTLTFPKSHDVRQYVVHIAIKPPNGSYLLIHFTISHKLLATQTKQNTQILEIKMKNRLLATIGNNFMNYVVFNTDVHVCTLICTFSSSTSSSSSSL